VADTNALAPRNQSLKRAFRLRPHANLWLPSGHHWQSRSVGWGRRGARGRDRTLRLPVIRIAPSHCSAGPG